MTEAAVDLAGKAVCPKHPQYFLDEDGKCSMCEDWEPGDVDLSEPPTPAEVAEVVAQGEIMAQVEQFEGSDVVDWEVKLPGATVECDRSFKRGSIVRMAVEVRIKGVGYLENKEGKLIRTHAAVIEDVSFISSYDPSENRENVGGNLSGSASDEGDGGEPSALGGLQIGRTQDAWPPKE